MLNHGKKTGRIYFDTLNFKTYILRLNSTNYKVKTFRWMFILSIIPIFCLFTFPLIIFRFPIKVTLRLELLGILTVGVLFALFLLGISIYGVFIDKHRKHLYIFMITLMIVWVLWACFSWTYIEHMDYLLH